MFFSHFLLNFGHLKARFLKILALRASFSFQNKYISAKIKRPTRENTIAKTPRGYRRKNIGEISVMGKNISNFGQKLTDEPSWMRKGGVPWFLPPPLNLRAQKFFRIQS